MQLGWIDFSKTERNKILSVLELLSDNGTLDELGIAPIRDGFSNIFFPGTSTIQTRAKYFLIVPYALRDLELGSETNVNNVLKLLDQKERECGETFRKQNEKEEGIVGKRSLQRGHWVKRTPADIYWSGLRRYGIFTGGNISLTEYVRSSCALRNRKATLKKLGNRNDNAEEYECDDKNAGDIGTTQFWKMPLYEKTWFDTLSIKLTEAEGAFLKEQIINTCPDTLLSYILKNNEIGILDCKDFHEIQHYVEIPEQLKEDYALAISFSDFLYVIRTLYNIIISDEKNELANKEFELLKEEMVVRADVDIDHIMARTKVMRNDLRNFLKQVQECMKKQDVEGMIQHIKSREIQLKGFSRAKTAHPGEFDPEAWIGGGVLNYRFHNAQTIIRDIFESEGIIDVKSE